MRSMRTVSWLMLGLAGLLVSVAPAAGPEEDAGRGPQPGSRHPRPDPVAHLRRAASSTRRCARSSTTSTRTSRSSRSSPPRCPPSPTAARRSRSSCGRGVKFNDGTPMNAEAVRFSLDRHLHMKGSNRRSELELDQRDRGRGPPHGPAQAQGAVRPARRHARRPRGHAGVAGRRRTSSATSSAPRRSAWGRGASSSACRRTASCSRSPRTTSTPARRASTSSSSASSPTTTCGWPTCAPATSTSCTGSAPTDSVNLKKEGRFEVASVTGIGYNGITINLHNKTGKTQPPGNLGTPLANDPRVREALDLSHRPRGAEPGGVGRPVHAGLHAHRADQPLLRQEPQVPGAGRGQGEEAPRRRRASRAGTASR